MAARSSFRRNRRGLPWWTALIFALIALLVAGWYFIFNGSEIFINERIVGEYSLDDSGTISVYEDSDTADYLQTESAVEHPSTDQPWIALIIDDFGSPASAKLVDCFLSLPYELTFSIIPGNVKSISIGKRIHAVGGEVFIHLPMEPTRKVAMNERDMVLVGMTAVELEAILDRVTGEHPYAVGINNHMGSKATLDDRLMEMMAFELSKRSLVFVDSRTVAMSRALTVMKSAGLPVLARDVFIDNPNDVRTIRERILQLLRIAAKRGWAIGIAHARQTTFDELKQMTSIIENSGVKVVTASTLVNAIWNLQRFESPSVAASSAR